MGFLLVPPLTSFGVHVNCAGENMENEKTSVRSGACAAPGFPQGSREKTDGKLFGGELALPRRFDGRIRKRTPMIFRSFLDWRTLSVNERSSCSPMGARG